MKRKPRTGAETASVIVVAVVSFLHLLMHASGGWQISFITTLIGLAFLACFFFGIKMYTYLLFTWALMQTIYVSFPLGDEMFDLSQVIAVHLGLNTPNFSVGLAPLGIPLCYLAMRVYYDSILGQTFTLKAFKQDSFLADILPAEIQLLRRFEIGEEKSWFLAEIKGKEIPVYALIRGKDKSMITAGEKQIVQYLRVDDPQWVIHTSRVERHLFKVGGWAVIM